MGIIIKLGEDQYIEWSNVCDAPLGSVMSKDEARALVEWELGLFQEPAGEKIKALKKAYIEAQIEERWERIERTGTSAHDGQGAEDIARFNRAGEGEKSISLEEIIELYTFTKEKKGKFPFR